MRDCAVGIDIGTTAVKSIVYSARGEILFEKAVPHDLISKEPGYAEEDPTTWWQSVSLLLSSIQRDTDTARIAGLCFSGMVPTVILLDDAGTPIRPSIQQNDARAVAEIAEWKAAVDEDDYFRRTGNTVNQQVVFPTFDWLRRNEPENVERAATVLGSYNYATFKATGVRTLDTNWALESGYWLVREQQWDHDTIERSGIRSDRLPPVYDSAEIVGSTTEELQRETGFPAGIPVLAGIADHVASALSTGVRSEGDLLLKLGGAGDILFATDDLRLDRRLFIDYHPVPGTYLINGCMAAGGSVVKWLMQLFETDDFDRLTDEAELLPPGSDDLVVLPYFLGEKTPIFDTNARGVFFGLNLGHTRAHLFRSVLESVAFAYYHHLEVLQEIGFDVRRVFLSNGGARSRLWKQIVLDVVGHDGVYVPDHPGSCIGAAMLALESTGVSRDWESLRRFLDRGVAIPFTDGNHRRYREYYKVYRELYENLKPLFPRLPGTAGREG